MMSVAIVGLLASVAIPTFDILIWKVKRSERDRMLNQIENAVIQYITAHDQFPRTSGANTYISAPYNPPWPVTASKEVWAPNYLDWRHLDVVPDGRLYFHYYVTGWQGPSYAYFYVYGFGDMDEDGINQYRYRYWRRDQHGYWRMERDYTSSDD